MSAGPYHTIENLLPIMGQRIEAIGQHSEIEFYRTGQTWIDLYLSDGSAVRIFVSDDGFIYSPTGDLSDDT